MRAWAVLALVLAGCGSGSGGGGTGAAGGSGGSGANGGSGGQATLVDGPCGVLAFGHVPGVTVPKTFVDRMEAAGDGAEEEGVQIALETIQAVKSKKGVNGIHLMAMGWEEVVPRLVEESGLNKPQLAAAAR